MFWITLALMIFESSTQIYYFSTGTWNLNRTIGWGWDITNYLVMLISNCLVYSLPLFTIGYGILFFLKRKTTFTLSLLHLFLMIIMIYIHPEFLGPSMILLNLSWLIFSLNIYKSEKIIH